MNKRILLAPLALLAFGMAQAASIDTGRGLYGTYCASCHGALGTPWNASAATIQRAIQGNRGGMGRLSGLSVTNLQDIAAYMANPHGSDATTTGTTTGTTGTATGTTTGGGTTAAATNVANADLDRLFDGLETHYPRIFGSHAVSTDLSGYYVRHYPDTHVYLAARNGLLYFYDASRPRQGVQELGSTATWLRWIDLLAGTAEHEGDEHGEDDDD
jgi:hypothetical protein